MKKSNNNINKKCERYTIAEKFVVIRFKKDNMHLSQADLAKKFNTPVGTIN